MIRPSALDVICAFDDCWSQIFVSLYDHEDVIFFEFFIRAQYRGDRLERAARLVLNLFSSFNFSSNVSNLFSTSLEALGGGHADGI